MDVKSIYLQALRERDPQALKELLKSGQLESHLQQVSELAHEAIKAYLAKNGDSLASEREAEEWALHLVLDFPDSEESQKDHPEPPDDIMAPR